MDSAGGDAARGLFDQRPPGVCNSNGRTAEARAADDHRPATGGYAVSGEHGTGLVGGSGALRLVVCAVLLLGDSDRRAVLGPGRPARPPLGYSYVLRVGGMGVVAAAAW